MYKIQYKPNHGKHRKSENFTERAYSKYKINILFLDLPVMTGSGLEL